VDAMEKMKVAMYYNNNDVRIEEMPIPEINENELLVKVIASGICGSDVMEWYRVKKAPIVLGHEISGIIEKAGINIKKFKKGDRIFVTHHVPCNECSFCQSEQQTLCHTLHNTKFYPGGFAQYLRVPEININNGTFILPEEVSFDEGTFIEPLACVVRGFRIANYQKRKTIVVLGSGMAGLLNIKLAKLYGAKKIFATDIDDYRLDFSKKVGADFVINAKEDIAEHIKKHNDGKLADFVILCVGVPTAIRQAIESVNFGGTILWFAMTPPGVDVTVPFFDIWNKQIKMYSTYAGVENDITEAIDLLKSKQLDVNDMITHKLPMDKTPEGFKLVANAKESMKVIIEPHK
jgi:L-iditol 2-dehydrogenase